jgi:hypothetical protein
LRAASKMRGLATPRQRQTTRGRSSEDMRCLFGRPHVEPLGAAL